MKLFDWIIEYLTIMFQILYILLHSYTDLYLLVNPSFQTCASTRRLKTNTYMEYM